MTHPYTSDQTGDIIEAMFNVQKELRPIIKDKANPFFKSKYADFNAIWETVQPLLEKNNLLIVQAGEPVLGTDGTRNYLQTTIFHVPTGQFITGTFPLVVSKGDAQAMGSAITYMRRYSLSSMLCLCTEDDDGNAAVGNPASEGQTTGKVKFQ